MGGARALIASLGASISLVAGAALSLLIVSFLFAYDGLGGGGDEPATHAALRVPGQAPVASQTQADGSRLTPVVIRTPATRPVARTTAPPRGLREGRGGVQTRRPAPTAKGVSDLGAASAPAATSDPSASAPATGDGVRDLGDSVSTTVGDTGDAAGSATAPLGPPVTQAVQDVLNLVESLLNGATSGLAGTLDRALPRR